MKKVLVVDDNDVSRELMCAFLQRVCGQLLEAANGREALNLIMETEPDLVLLDIEMPLMDGFAVLERVRSDPRFLRLPVFAVTANAMQGDREKALAAGFDGYITKPIDGAALRKQVAALLGSGEMNGSR